MVDGIEASKMRVTFRHTLPASVKAGALVRWSVTLRCEQAIASGAVIGIARKWPDDGGRPQWSNPEAVNFVSAQLNDEHCNNFEWLRMEKWHPFDHALLLTLTNGLACGEELTINFGGSPSPGFEAQTYVEAGSTARLLIRPACGEWGALGDIVTHVLGNSAERLVALAPSVVGAGEDFELLVRLEDKWGNPASCEGLEIATSCGTIGWIDDSSVARLRMKVAKEGVHRIVVVDRADHFKTTSNPIRCQRTVKDRIFWGDLHAQSSNGCGAQMLADYFAFARDFAGADFAGHQGNCFLLSNSDWQESVEVTSRINVDGRFVALLGYEWSGETAVGGDHNVYFPGDHGDLRRCSHRHVLDKSDEAADLPHVTDLHSHVRGKDVLLAVHVGGRTSNLEWHEPGTERLLEVHSTHATSEWFLFEALRRGYRLGVVAGSDGVDGRPGASHPGRMAVRNLRGGLAAVKMRNLTRGDLWEALRARATYGTTGQRILLEVDVEGHGFGETLDTVDAPRITVSVEGTAPLTSVEIFRGCDPVFAAPIQPFDATPSNRLRLSWYGASEPGHWARARMIWDARVRVVGGRLLAARDWASDTPAEGITNQGADGLAFHSVTAGNWNGLELEIEEGPHTTIHFDCERLAAEFPLSKLDIASVQKEVNNPLRRVKLQRLPRAPAPLGWSGSFVDAHAAAGEHLYWVRVGQDDGGCAWSSPVYVRIAR